MADHFFRAVMSPHGAASKAWHGLHPMLRAGLTSGTIMAGGDLLCQTIQMQYQPAVAGTAENEKVEKPKKCEERPAASTSGAHWMSAAVREKLGLADYDLVRTARFFGVGLTLHGPFFNKGLGILEKVVGPATTVQAAAKKVALGHFFLFPSYTALFYSWLAVFEGKGLEGGMQKFTDTWWDIFVAGSAFWPAANMVNFMYCPPMYRVLYLNVAGLYWNAFLSYQNVRATAMEAIIKQE